MTQAATLRERLRAETRPAHDALDNALDLTGPPLRLDQYARLLGRFHGFHQAIEPALAQMIEPSLWAGRSKLAALRHDLRRCGLSDMALERLPPMDGLPPIPDRPAAFGAFYVSEGSTLGGRMIGRLLQKNAEIPSDARTYLEIYGDQTATRWHAVCEALGAATNHKDDQRTIRTADLVFASLQRWLMPCHWRKQPLSDAS